jgi:hypothetical protein
MPLVASAASITTEFGSCFAVANFRSCLNQIFKKSHAKPGRTITYY